MKKLFFIFITLTSLSLFFTCSGDKDDDKEGEGNKNDGKPECGNGIIEEGEECDGNVKCGDAGHFWPENEAVCKSDCSGYDVSKCLPRDANDTCNNNQKESHEACEQGETKPCKDFPDLNYVSGDATCNRYCNGWDDTDCSAGNFNTCAQILKCVDACADDECKQKCIDAGSEDGKKLYEYLDTCYTSACPSGADKRECMQENCYDEYYNCHPTEKCGNGKIDDGEICEKKDTKPCQELADNWQPINEATCKSSCDGWDTFDCVDVNDFTCYQTFECVQGCTDSDCEKECLDKTSDLAQNKYNIMMECVDKNCPVITEECINENCKYQSDVCKTHLTCKNKKIDQYEVCEQGDSIDCGDIKDENDEAIYEAGTESAFCDSTCTGWISMLCHKFCSCAEIKLCVADKCGEYKDAEPDCIMECEDLGSAQGSMEHSAWYKFISGCSSDDGKGFESQNCIDKANQESECGNSDHPKCPY